MKNFYADLLKDDLWLIKESKWDRSLQGIRETQFTLGNGYLGIRGVLEEIPYDATPGTYIAGVYDKMGSQVDELVNLPNPVNFRFTIAGEKLDLVATNVLEHMRILNMKKGVLIRETLYKDTKKHRYNYQSLRFVARHRKNIGAMQIAITPLDAGCEMDINTGIDTSVANAGVLSEGRKRHFRVRELGQFRNAGYLVIETMEKKHIIVYWSGFYYRIDSKKISAEDNVFRLKLKKGQTVLFTKIFCLKHFSYRDNHTRYRNETFKIFDRAFRSKFSSLLTDNTKMWKKLWDRADILIEGQENLQRNMRFNIYHMLVCAHYDGGFSSIGARTLSGEGYRGHIFWDTEIFLMPFYLFNFPRVAKNMLLYRYKRLDSARELARTEGFKGVKFPWESAGTGEEETPEWSKDFDGTVIRIHTHEQEHHITADIAYAVCKYCAATGDEEFMEKFGYEIVFETARFWASRVVYNRRKKQYEINNVIGPDEFHNDVNNNAYTNMMAKWNLAAACKLFSKIRKKSSVYRKIKEQLNLKENEPREWKKIASGIGIHMNKKKIIEQFDGYLKLKRITLTKTDENGILLVPPRLKAKDLRKTNLIKQADVVALLHLLGDLFNLETKIANYEFYIHKTVHKSSLSPSIYCLAACEVGDLSRAFDLFNVCLNTDIGNLYGNTREGMHAASLGGTWQALVFGFAGIRIRRGKMRINPSLPRRWSRVSFSLIWKGDTIKFELTNDTIKLKANSRVREAIELGIFDKMMQVKTNRAHLFKRRIVEKREEGFY